MVHGSVDAATGVNDTATKSCWRTVHYLEQSPERWRAMLPGISCCAGIGVAQQESWWFSEIGVDVSETSIRCVPMFRWWVSMHQSKAEILKIALESKFVWIGWMAPKMSSKPWGPKSSPKFLGSRMISASVHRVDEVIDARMILARVTNVFALKAMCKASIVVSGQLTSSGGCEANHNVDPK